ncbi:MAG: TonB-dependent receptor [Chitinophagaceae bacterium]
MKKLLLIAAAIACSLLIQAQSIIRGKVYDGETNNPLSGATISIGGKSAGSTDGDGSFSVPCGRAIRVTVSFIGYETKTQVVKNCNEDLSILLTPSSHILNEVEITALSGQNKALLYQPSSIAKLNTMELKRATGLFLDDAINANIPGVTMQRRAVSSGQTINIRGYGNGVRGTNGISSNFDIQGTKVYFNGIPITDAEGITLMDDIDFGSVGNVEVVKGPSGTLYGLAIAGVVNLKTIKPEKGKTSVGQEVMMGSNGLRRYTTHFQMGADRSSLLVNYGYQKSDGFMVHNRSTKRFVNVAGDYQINNKQAINTYFGYSNSYDERGGELTITQYINKDYSGNPAYIKNNAHSNIISFRAGVGHTYNFTDRISNTTTVFGSGISNNVSSAAGWTDKNPINYGLRSTVNSRFLLGANTGLSGISGVELQQQRAQVIGYAMIPDSNNLTGYNRIGAMRSNQFSITGTSSLFTEWTLSFPHDLSVTAGVGLSTMNIELKDRFYVATAARVPSAFKTKYGGMVSPHLAINKVFNKQFSLYASYSKGYKAPVSAYFYIPFVTGAPGTGMLNGGLKPEEGTQYEAGAKGSVLNNRFIYELAVFNALFSNKMTSVAVPLNSTTTAYSYIVNGGKQDNKGIEALVKFVLYQSNKAFITSIRPFANAAYSKFKYKDFKYQALNGTRTAVVETDYSGKTVAGVPPLTANVGIDMMTKIGLYATAYYSYRDPMIFTSTGLNKTDSYNLVNGKMGIKQSMGSHFDLDAFIGATNLTGTQYYYMVFVNQLPDAYLPAPLKTAWFGGINLKYNF